MGRGGERTLWKESLEAVMEHSEREKQDGKRKGAQSVYQHPQAPKQAVPTKQHEHGMTVLAARDMMHGVAATPRLQRAAEPSNGG
jgi:hypothetical protein